MISTRIGQIVVVESGPLKGLEGKVLAVDALKGTCKVRLEMYENSFVVTFSIAALRGRNEWLQTVTAEQLPHAIQVEKRIAAELQKRPEQVDELSARDFEYLIAELLQDMGYETVVTQHSKDKGRDILAVLMTPLGRLLTIVECKRYRLNRPVGVEPVQRMLWVADRIDKASSAMLATTSTFTYGAKAIEREHRYKLQLRDNQNILSWIRRYGKGTKVKGSLLWTNEDFQDREHSL
jgi:HJR/Mrr/RecB family endonuclease